MKSLLFLFAIIIASCSKNEKKYYVNYKYSDTFSAYSEAVVRLDKYGTIEYNKTYIKVEGVTYFVDSVTSYKDVEKIYWSKGRTFIPMSKEEAIFETNNFLTVYR